MLVRLLLSCLLVMFIISLMPASEAHLPHLPHYNGGSQLSNGYMIVLGTDPEYIRPGEGANLIISIQDTNGNDLNAVKALVKIFKDEQLVKEFPLDIHPTGDFEESYTFSDAGIYQVEIDTYGSKEFPYSAGDVAASASYNIFVSQWAGQIINSVMAVSIVIPLAVLGAVLGFRTKALRKSKGRLDKDSVIQYVAALSAIAAGMIHTVIYGEHSTQSIFIGVFFIIAGLSQVSYGMLYMMFKKRLLNYVGLFGTVGIIGLYIYAVTLPAPLYSRPVPEGVEVIGVAVKVIESILLISLIYIISRERRLGLRTSTGKRLDEKMQN